MPDHTRLARANLNADGIVLAPKVDDHRQEAP